MTESHPVLRELDAVTVPVPDLDSGLDYYRDKLGHALLWRNDDVGQAGLALPDAKTELVLTTRQRFEPNWLVDSIDDAVAVMIEAGGSLVVAPAQIPVGRVAVVADPFGNPLVLVEIVKRYPTGWSPSPQAVEDGCGEQPRAGEDDMEQQGSERRPRQAPVTTQRDGTHEACAIGEVARGRWRATDEKDEAGR